MCIYPQIIYEGVLSCKRLEMVSSFRSATGCKLALWPVTLCSALHPVWAPYLQLWGESLAWGMINVLDLKVLKAVLFGGCSFLDRTYNLTLCWLCFLFSSTAACVLLAEKKKTLDERYWNYTTSKQTGVICLAYINHLACLLCVYILYALLSAVWLGLDSVAQDLAWPKLI